MALLGYNLPFFKCFAAMSPIFITLNCSSFAGNPRFCLRAYAWIYLQWLLCLTVPLCDWTSSVHSVCLHTFGFCGWVFWLCVQARASTHTHTSRRKVGFRNIFPAILHSHKVYAISSTKHLQKCFFSILPGWEGKFYCNNVERSVPKQILLFCQVFYIHCCNPGLCIAHRL